ncbi:hypothetical protein [Streptomyces sp. NPDC053427]|uniref:hypothetical protein n=1 Tax=Streptomyces sp. NPDC053427 TaxID=3365701 RepID=UPI0037D12CE7
MTTSPLPGIRIEIAEHRLTGLRVTDAEGRTGILGHVVIERDRQTQREVSRTAHLRPVDASGIEWTTHPDEIEAAQ